jgi:protein-S-isoprenylcysteine O-methyltransferase Ste14
MSDSPEPSAATRESGGAVRIPAPPLLFAAPLAATLALQRWLPLPLPGRPVTKTVGAVLTIAGIALSASGAATFRRNRTTVVPHHPVSTLVTEGPYRISRNPMYTGLAAAYVGAALWAGT